MSEQKTKPSTAERIVVVEDSPPNRKILMHLLEKLGYQVEGFEDGKKAWEALEKETPPGLVAIISDIMMPNMNGIDLLRKVRESENYKDMPFLLITAVSDKDYILEAKSLQVSGYILKPVTFQRVTGKLQELFPNKTFPKLAA